MIGANINAYFEAAMKYPVERLAAVMRGQDNSIPQAAAMMALQVKKPMVDAAKGQQAANAPKQPSVKDQMETDIGMLPENVGVMNLPAPNMDSVNMADGGIVAFDDGGAVPGYAGTPMWGSLVGGSTMLPPASRESARIAEQMTASEEDRAAQRNALIQTILGKQAQNIPLSPAEQSMVDRSADVQNALAQARTQAAAAPMSNYEVTPQEGSQSFAQPAPFVDARQTSARDTTGRETPVAERTGIGAAAATRRRTPAASAAAAPAPTGVAPDSYEAMIAGVKKNMPDIEGKYGALGTEMETGLAKLQTERERAKPQGKAMEGLEKLLTKEEGEAETKKDRNLSNALVNAGFAIAAGKSQNALQNIAEGAQVGTKTYQAGLEKLDEASKERAKMFAQIEEARRAESRGDWKDAADAKQKAFEASMGMKKFGIEGLAKAAEISTNNATQLWNNAQTNKRALEVAQLQSTTDLQKAGIMAGAQKEMNTFYKEGQLRNEAMNLAQKMLDEKMKAFQLEKLTMTPEKYEQWRQHYIKQAFKQIGIAPPGTTTQGSQGTQGQDPALAAALNQYNTP